MKLYEKKRIQLYIIASIGGLIFSAFGLYDQTGKIGKTEIIALTATAIVITIVTLIIIKIGNKC
jgi:hypothetical protein